MNAATTRSPAFTAISTAFVLTATAVAATAFWPIYETPHFVVMVALTLLAATTIAVVGARFRWHGPVMVGATLLTYLALGVPLAVPGAAHRGVLPTADGLVELITGAALGWRQLITITIPVGSYQALLVPAFLLLLVSVVAALSIALRAENGELAAPIPAIVLIVGLALGPRDAPHAVALCLTLLTVTLAWLGWRRWYRRRDAIRALAGSVTSDATRERMGGLRVIASAGVLLVLATAVGAAASVATPTRTDRTVLRDTVQQPFDPRGLASPLSGLRRYHQPTHSDETMFVVRDLPEGARIRLATLDTYDGVVFSVGTPTTASASGSFTRLPTYIERDADDSDRIEVGVDIIGYDGIWVPMVGLLEAVQFTGDDATALRESFYFNDVGHVGVTLEGLDGGDQLSLSSVLPATVPDERLAALSPGSATVPAPELMPDSLAVTLDAWVRDASTPGGRLTAMLDRLTLDGYVSHGVDPDQPFSRSGHGVDRIDELLTDPRMIGDEEQYAVTAALMARIIGFPSRVVFGFAPDTTDAGVTLVTGSDVSAWIEVHTAQHGWVEIDPTPDERPIPDEEPEDPATVARPQSPVPPPAVEPDPRRDQAPLDATQDEDDDTDPLMALLLGALRAIMVLAVIALVISSPVLAILIAKMRRRHRRQRATTAADRVSGGWREFEDIVLDHGYTIPPAATRSEVAEVVGGVRPLVLASVADRAVFAPEHIDDDEARQVWAAVRDLEAGISATRTRRQRLLALISLRSLAGYSVRELLSRERRRR